MMNRSFLLTCLVLVSCMTPEQQAAQRQQQLMQQAQQQEQLREFLINSCEKIGFKRGTSEILECAARRGEAILQQNAQQTAPRSAWGNATSGVRTSFGESMMPAAPASYQAYPRETQCMQMGAFTHCENN